MRSMVAVVVVLALASAGCSADNPAAQGGCATASAVVVTSASPGPLGGLNRVALGDHAVVRGIDNTLDADSVVRAAAGKVYALMRTKGVLRIYDTVPCFTAPVEVVVGDSVVAHDKSDPTDALAIAGASKVYVAAYGNDAAHAIAVVDTSLATPAVTRWIALPASAGSSKPRPTQLWSCGALVYAFLEDLNDSFALTGPGRVAVIDPRTDALVSDGKAMIALQGSNPGGGFPYGVTAFDSACDDVLVADAGDLSGMSQDRGGIERVDLAARSSRGLLWKGATDLQANVGAIAAAGPHLLYAVLGSNSNQVVALDQTGVSRLGDVLGPVGYVPFVQVSPDHQVFIGVNFSMGGQAATGLYVAPADGARITAAPLTFDQPPYGIAFL